jgi:hypothetical protein
MLVPEGLLFASTSAYVDLRRQLVENYELLAVISLQQACSNHTRRKNRHFSVSSSLGGKEKQARRQCVVLLK